MNKEEKQVMLSEIEQEILTIQNELKRISKLPIPKSNSGKLRRLKKILNHTVRARCLAIESHIILSQPLHSFESGCACVKEEGHEEIVLKNNLRINTKK